MPSNDWLGRTRVPRKRAVIDIGSNTVRLVIFGGPPRAPAVLFNEKATAKLGRGVAEEGLLTRKSMQSALAALRRFAAILRTAGVKDVQVVATAAVRDADNGSEFLQQVADLGLQPRLLSGEEEAVTSATGVAAAFPGAVGIVADLGGGSLELIDIDPEGCEHGTSLPLGTLLLPELRRAGPSAFARRVQKLLKETDWSAQRDVPLFLVGGSTRAFAHYAIEAVDWPVDDPHGFELPTQMAAKLARAAASGQLPASIAGVSSSRMATLPDAAALLAVLLRELQPSRLVFSSWGLREGLLFRSLDRSARMQDPLLAGVSAFAESMNSPAPVAAMTAGWTAACNPSGVENHERLRLAATMLALALQKVEPNLRVDQALKWTLRKRWIGIGAEGRAMLAAALVASTGRPVPTAVLGKIASPQQLAEGAAWGLAIRLCRRFCLGSAQSMSNSRVSVEGGQLVLTARDTLNDLLTDTIEKDLRILAEALGLEPRIETLS